MNNFLKTALLLLLCNQIVFGQSLNLRDCYEKAEKHHPTASQKALINEAAALQTKQFNRNYLPQLSLNGQATWQSEVTSVDIPFPGFEITPPPKDQYRFTLDLNQTIWDGGINIRQKDMAAKAAIADRTRVETEIWAIRRQVHQLYFGVLLAEKQSEQLFTLRKDLETKKAKIIAAIDNGVAIKSDLFRFDAKLLEFKQQENELAQRKIAALEGLGLLIGEELSTDISLGQPSPLLVDDSQILRPELDLFDAQKQLLESQISLIKVKNNPKLFAFARGGYGRPGLNMLSSEFQPYFIGGLKFQVPLTHLYSGQSKLEIRQLEIQSQRIEHQKESFLLASEVQIKQLQNEVTRLESLLKTDAELLELRKKIKATAEEQWNNGIATSSDYLEEVNQEDLIRQKMILHEVLIAQARQELSWLRGK